MARPRQFQDRVAIHIYMESEMEYKLNQECRKMGISRGEFARKAIETLLNTKDQ